MPDKNNDTSTVSVDNMRRIDAKAVSRGLPIYLMMENAGNALARCMLEGFNNNLQGRRVTVVCGLSNNGGGGFASARHLAYYGADVSVILLGEGDRDIKTSDARLQWNTLQRFEIIHKFSVLTKDSVLKIEHVIIEADGIVDAIFGTGYSSGRIREPHSTVIDLINSSNAYVVSNDIPSGTNADTAQVVEKSVKPNVIVVLHRKKPGITGRYIVQSIGIPNTLA